jgi:hypothetical protein
MEGEEMSISTWVARIGSNSQFVAFNAHWGVTYFLLHVASPYASLWVLIPIVLLVAAIKEFWFDAKNEANQTFLDNLEDWLGYAVGCVLAISI